MKRDILFLLFGGLLALACVQKPSIKINGLSLVATRDSLSAEHLRPVQKMHANYVALMPFGFVRDLEHPEILYNMDRQWFGETSDGIRQYIDELKDPGIQVMMKPQLWIWRGAFTGYMKMKSEQDWKDLENCYRNFILDFAMLAEEKGVPIFCIGTELEQFVNHRPQYWFDLVKEIRKIYSGKLTYAANWDEYKRVPFWDELDFIGVDAYFPISKSRTPTLEEARQGWSPWKEEMKDLSERYQKPILFTEYGYRSVDFAGREPWVSDREMNEVNLTNQVVLLEALYKEVWEESWFAGGFLWKWHPNHEMVGGSNHALYTPQGKPAELLIQSFYGH